MFFPEFLYQLSERDLKVTWLDPIIRRLTNSQAAATVNNDFEIPDAQAFMLQGFTLQGNPGAAQFVSQLFVAAFVTGTATPMILLKQDDVDAGANEIKNMDWQGSLIIPPSWSIRGSATFNAGVAANECTLGLFGILIPVGNIQRV